MSFKAFLKRCLMEYFIITTCVTAAMGLLGLSMEPGARFGYEAFFSPLLFGLVSLLPSLVTYSRKELSLRRTLVRKLIYLILLEGTLILFSFWAGILQGTKDALTFGCAVLLVYLAVNLISWQLEKKEAGQINRMLKSMRENPVE